MMDRRSFLASSGLVALGGLAGSAGMIGPAMAQQPKPFALGTFGGIFETTLKEMSPKIASDLGLKVDLTIGSGQVIGAKLQAGQARNPPFAAVNMTADLLQAYSSRGLLRPFTEQEVPNLMKVQPRLRELTKVPGGYAGMPMYWQAIGILWRKDLVPFEITSWKDLWRPELKNRISIQTTNALGGALMLIAASHVHGGSATDLEPGWKALQALKPNVREYYAITSNAITALVSGDTWVSVNGLDFGLPLADKGVVVTVPKEGIPFGALGFGVAKGGDEQSALKFINYMLDDPQQLQWAKTAMVAPSTNVALPPELQARMVENEALMSRLMAVDYGYLAQNMPAISDRGRRELSN